MKNKQIVDDLIYILKKDNTGHIDRDNALDVLNNYIEGIKNQSEFEVKSLKADISEIISELEDLI